MHRRNFVNCLVALSCLGGPVRAWGGERSLDLPDSVVWMVPSPPGGGPDLVARTLAEAIGRISDVTVRVQNIEGGNGEVALARFFNERPHPGVWLMAQDSVVVINPLLHPRSAHDVLDGLLPVAQLATNQFYLLVNSADSIQTLDEFIAEAQRDVAAMNYGSGGVGSQHHLLMEDLARRLDLRLNHVAYRGNRPAALGLARGDIRVLMAGASALSFVRSGEFRVIAVTSPERLPTFPQAPAIGERVQGFFGTAWFGLFARAGIEVEHAAAMAELCEVALTDPETVEVLQARGGVEASFVAGQTFVERIHKDHERFRIIHAAL